MSVTKRVAPLQFPPFQDGDTGVCEITDLRAGKTRRVAFNGGERVPGYTYNYPAKLNQEHYGDITQRHADSNLILCGGYQWRLPGNLSMPWSVTLDQNMAVLDQLRRHAKPAGEVQTDHEHTASEWASRLRREGYEVAIEDSPGYGRRWHVWAAAISVGPETEEESDLIKQEWDRIGIGLGGGNEWQDIVDRVARTWRLADFQAALRTDGAGDGGLVALGYALGYPPLTTWSVMRRQGLL